MKLGISSYSFPWSVGVKGYPPEAPMTALDLLAAAQEHGVGLVQIADNLPLHRLRKDELGRVKDRVFELGIEIELGTRGLDPERLDTYIGLASYLGASILRTVTDTADHRPDREEIVESIGAMLPRLKRAGVVLAVENHERLAAAALADIVQRLASPSVGICLDTTNSFGALEGPDVVVDTLAPYVVNLHVKDFTIRRFEYSMGFIIEGCPAGQGRLHIPRLLETLSRRARAFNVIVEHWPPPEATVEATVSKEKAWVGQSVGYLRGLIPD